jgi:hypothetical protein
MLQIRSAIENSTSDYDKEKLQERLAKLSGGVAVLKVRLLTFVCLLMADSMFQTFFFCCNTVTCVCPPFADFVPVPPFLDWGS